MRNASVFPAATFNGKRADRVPSRGFVAPTRWVAGNHDIGNKPMADGKGQVSAERIARYQTLLGAPFYAVDLLPGLRVILKASGVREAIEAAGAELRYLPPYSPDFNPIENLWSKVKGKLQSLAARGIDTLHDAIADALTTVTPADCVGFFRHCGYAATLERALL